MVQHLINPKRRPEREDLWRDCWEFNSRQTESAVKAINGLFQTRRQDGLRIPRRIGHTPNIQKRMENQDWIVTKGEYLVFTGKMFTYGYGSWLCLTQLQRSDSTCLIHEELNIHWACRRIPWRWNPWERKEDSWRIPTVLLLSPSGLYTIYGRKRFIKGENCYDKRC